MTTTRYLWNPINQNIIREYDGAGNTVASYTTEPDLYGDVVSQRRDGQNSVYHSDGQGSTLALTDATDNVTDTYAYTAFGEVADHSGVTVNPFQYVGRSGYYRDDQTGDHTVRKRQLGVRYGRWMSVDPLSKTLPTEAPYNYVLNRPVYFVDPSGLFPPPGAFAKIPICPCTLPEIWKAPNVQKDDPRISKKFHPGSAVCYRIWTTGATAGNQCCFDDKDNLITHGPGAGTPDIYNPTDLISHFRFDVVPFNALCESHSIVAAVDIYHHQGWAPVYNPKCKDNPEKKRPGARDKALLDAITKTALSVCNSKCIQEFGLSSEYEDCMDECVPRTIREMMDLAASGPITIEP